MPLKATKFIQNRKKIVGITYDRVHYIMSYVVECYNLQLTDKPSYSKAHIAATAYNFEDHLKMEFVENYLVKNKHLLFAKLPTLEEVTFTYENIRRFTDTKDGIEKSDKIDVYVNRLGLKNEWGVQEEHLYLAIECKRINTLSDCQKYVDDIQKFCDREYKELRIPFESQIAFVENSKLDHIIVSKEINRRLQSTPTIITKQLLNQLVIHSSFQSSYISVHKKNYKKKESFKIFHLIFDYSQLVVA